MPPPDVFDLMRRSLDTMAAEAPEAEAALRKAVGPIRARLATQGRTRLFHLTTAGFALDEADDPADVEIAFDRALVLDLAEGRLSLEEALLADRLGAKGSVDAVTRLHEALMIYLEGLLRAPGAAALYEEYCET
jgi:hypothetical protein